MPITEEKYEYALAVKIQRGRIIVNGQFLSVDSKELPKGVSRVEEYFLLPEQSLLDTEKDAVFFLHPANKARLREVVSKESYAEVRGNDREFRICVQAPMEPYDSGQGQRINKAPVSYLHYYQEPNAKPYLELQFNEGSVRVVA